MRCDCGLVTGLMALVRVVLGVDVGLGEEAELRERLEKRVYRDAGGESIPYRLFVPAGYDAGKEYPAILFLHGAGERGNDNKAQLKHPGVLRLVMDEANPCFLVAPQCPGEQKWVDVPWEFEDPHKTPDEPSPAMRLTMELLDALEKEFSIDPQRRYVTGLSMGGFGTFDLLVRRPEDFAAAIPICGGADDSQAGKIADVPMWVFHGGKDGAVPVVRSRSAVEALRAAGGEPKYTEYRGDGARRLEPGVPGAGAEGVAVSAAAEGGVRGWRGWGSRAERLSGWLGAGDLRSAVSAGSGDPRQALCFGSGGRRGEAFLVRQSDYVPLPSVIAGVTLGRRWVCGFGEK